MILVVLVKCIILVDLVKIGQIIISVKIVRKFVILVSLIKIGEICKKLSILVEINLIN